jgi:hypothetical protein
VRPISRGRRWKPTGIRVAFREHGDATGWVVDEGGLWWVFDRPVYRDWLFLTGLVIGVVAIVQTVSNRDEFGALAFVFTLLVAMPSGVGASAMFAVPIRDFVRRRRRSDR